MLQMFWALGAIIVGGVSYYYSNLEEDIAYRYVLSLNMGHVTSD